MSLKPVGVPPARPPAEGTLAGARAPGPALPPDEHAEVAGQIERAYPGYHVWVSDAGWWYATRTHSRARGQSATVHGAGPGELSGALAAEEAVTMGRAAGGAW